MDQNYNNNPNNFNNDNNGMDMNQPMGQSMQNQSMMNNNPQPMGPMPQGPMGMNQPTFQPSVEEKPKNKTGLIIGIILVLLIIGVVAFLMLRGKGETNTEINNNSTETSNNSGNTDNTEVVSGDITLATIGHVDHGKTPLTSAITKYFGTYVSEEELNKAPEVNVDGIKFYASTVTYKTNSRNYLQYDFDGNKDIIKGLVSGSVKIDGAILVVSATDGPMGQTRSHLNLLRDVGVQRVVVFMNNCDLVSDDALLDLVEMEIRELLTEIGFDGNNTPIIKGSAKKALEGDTKYEQSVKDLMSSVDSWINPINRNEKEVSSKEFKAYVYIMSKEEGGRHTPFFNDYNPTFVIGNSSITGKVKLPSGTDMVLPGDDIEMTVNLNETLNMKKGQYFLIKEADKIVGTGVITSVN